MSHDDTTTALLQLRELIRCAEGAITCIELGLMRDMSEGDLQRYPKPCDCDFVIGHFAVKDLRKPVAYTPDDEGGPSMALDIAFLEIRAEVDRATAKFPTWPTDALHAVGVVAEEMGELQKEVMQLTYEPHKSTRESVRKEAVQLAAVAMRFFMSLDRYEYEPRSQHSQNK